jgi:NAD(P)-dependent dehydrogenase (short-subunit alcohol dehydrogenase family)
MKMFDASSTADHVLEGVDLTGKRFLLTGASSGIGLETARSLLSRGATIIGAVQDPAAAEAAMVELLRTLEKQGARDRLTLVKLDLGSLRSIRALAEVLVSEGKPLDALIANAGVMATPFGRTEDGFETQLAINYLGHFELINKLEPLIVDGGRVVILSSQAHRSADVDIDDLNFERQPYDPWVAYARSKTATSLFAVELDRRHRHRGVRAASVMPGNSVTNLVRHLAQEDLQSLLESVAKARAEAGLPPPMLKDVAQAAATTVWAAIVADKEEIGGHYLEDCAIARVDDTPNPFADGARSFALDHQRAQRLWDKTQALIDKAST